MNTDQTNTRDPKESRRLFLKQTGKKALWVAPVVTVIMTASSLRAEVIPCPSGGCPTGN